MDESSALHDKAKAMFTQFAKENTSLYVSHGVIEEFMFITLKFSEASQEDKFKNLNLALEKLQMIPGISVVSLPNDFESVDKVFLMLKTYDLLPNDAYILTILKFHQIQALATFDKKLSQTAKRLNIQIPLAKQKKLI